MIVNKIDISIIILNYQSYDRTISLVKRIIAQKSKFSFKICIVDNASPNNSYERLTKSFGLNSQIELLKSDINGGYAKGNNIGLRYMKKFNPSFALVINNDIDFELEVLEKCVNAIIQNKNVGIVSPIQILPNGNKAPIKTLKIPEFSDDIKLYLGPLSFEKKIRYTPNVEHKELMEVGWIPGSFMFFDYERLEELDFFDECTFLFCEEQFLARKTFRAGLKNYILTDCNYIHEHSATIKSFHNIRSQYKLLLDSQIKYAKKYYSFSNIKIPIIKVFNTFYRNILALYRHF